ncbi:hypothetical protein QQS21_010757 [Conoideocrella luteorostrata]|uniref:UDENN FLCN/SMCR8-type domain-containing protein n=1 Tax=Conoideocrella luteorostrata TaxID=1105319 RepID=A0AAJ0FP48_9HYPO|nr:hypothetical protein QQS21_010757 [Conoideocrella luteorostrata]
MPQLSSSSSPLFFVYPTDNLFNHWALTIHLILLCLAHYCDIHGPTPLMVTEGLRSPCSMCFEEPDVITGATSSKPKADKRTKSSGPTSAPQSHASAALNDALRDLSIGRSGSAPASEQDAIAQRAALRRSATSASNNNSANGSSALETPPESPRPVFQQPRRDSSFRRTYDDTVTKKQGPCDNCAMTLPRRQTAGAATDEYATGAHGPTLRTKAPVERVFGAAGQASPPNSQTSSDTDGDREPTHRVRSRKTAPTASSSRTTSCSSTSTSSERTPYHFHYVNYTSTHEPMLPDSFSLIRASCLRALSFETLPRPPATSTPTSSPQLNSSPSFVTTQSPGSAATGGPIFFGDALTGYTTAYIFRIPDMHARGHKRVYAFLALSTHKERMAMKTFSMVSTAFGNLASWIQQLAEAEVERTTTTSSPIGSVMYNGGVQPQPQASAFDPPAVVDRSSSSFLTGGSAFTRRTGGGPGASSLKARGLAELVGQPDFFIELHGKFVQLLFEVGVALNS